MARALTSAVHRESRDRSGYFEGSQSALQKHEAHLGDGGIGQGPLNAGLRQHDEGAVDGGGCSEAGQEVERAGYLFEERAEANHEGSTGVDNARMHQGGHGRGGAHGVGQPGVERELNGLQNGADRDEPCDPWRSAADSGELRQQVGEVLAPGVQIQTVEGAADAEVAGASRATGVAPA